jgi:hypothetical protein
MLLVKVQVDSLGLELAQEAQEMLERPSEPIDGPRRHHVKVPAGVTMCAADQNVCGRSIRRKPMSFAVSLASTPRASAWVTIAKTLNRERVAAPRGYQRGWAPTAIREIPRRELYRGVIVWDRSQKIVRGGTKKQRQRPEEEWLRIEAPEIRIVDEKLWRAVESSPGGSDGVPPHPRGRQAPRSSLAPRWRLSLPAHGIHSLLGMRRRDRWLDAVPREPPGREPHARHVLSVHHAQGARRLHLFERCCHQDRHG